MKYSFEQIKEFLKELLEKYCEPELSIWIDNTEYMIILHSDGCTFQKCNGKAEALDFETLDELYVSTVYDGIVLERDWDKITKFECYDFDYLDSKSE